MPKPVVTLEAERARKDSLQGTVSLLLLEPIASEKTGYILKHSDKKSGFYIFRSVLRGLDVRFAPQSRTFSAARRDPITCRSRSCFTVGLPGDHALAARTTKARSAVFFRLLDPGLAPVDILVEITEVRWFQRRPVGGPELGKKLFAINGFNGFCP